MIHPVLEATQPNIFHIHIDAVSISPELSLRVREDLGFYDSNFNGHPPGYVHFEPKQHLTLKVANREEFDSIWSRLEELASHEPFVGYLEGEFIPVDDFIPYKPHCDMQVPFRIARRRLSGSEHEQFRQGEFHLTYKKEESDAKLTEKLLEAGLYGAYMPKRDGEFVVLTMQGYIKTINVLAKAVRQYVEEAGGAYRCTLKEERAIRHKLFGVEANDLPEIADSVAYIEANVAE